MATLHERLLRLDERARIELERLRMPLAIAGSTLSLFRAGLRKGDVRFGLFGRDLLLSARLMDNPEFTCDVLRFVADTMGTRRDPRSGEEPGRGIHEYCDVEMRGHSTRYNAAEVSLLFLIEAAAYRRVTHDERTLRALGAGLNAALLYLDRHLKDGLFVEDPVYCSAGRYALRATYWKDSQLPERLDPAYPVVYALVQAQAIAALRAAADLVDVVENPPMGVDEIRDRGTRAVDQLKKELWDTSLDCPLIGLDRDGPISGVSSDALHMLAYLRPGDLSDGRLASMVQVARTLETPYGYRTYAPGQKDFDPHAYHLGAIWPFEQALIACGALRHGIAEVGDVALRVVDGVEIVGFAELYYWSEEAGLEGALAVAGQGCDLQLWTLCVPSALIALTGRKGE